MLGEFAASGDACVLPSFPSFFSFSIFFRISSSRESSDDDEDDDDDDEDDGESKSCVVRNDRDDDDDNEDDGQRPGKGEGQ